MHFSERFICVYISSFAVFRLSLMRPKWLKRAGLAQKICTLYTVSSLVHPLYPNDNLFEPICQDFN